MEFLKPYQEIINQAIEKYQFNREPKELYEPINYAIEQRGKRLRPVMLLMACDLFDGDLGKAIKPALGIDFFHNFTLIHDDIMDEAPLRRGKPTVHSFYGINSGILSGDALLIKAYQLFEDLDPLLFKKCVEIFSETGTLLCEGQQLDLNFETKKTVTYEQYIEMITKKTGVLSAASFQIGALIADANPDEAMALYEYGKNIGIAFQIMDDYLDVFGDQKSFGKKNAGDIYENKKTILHLLALELGNEIQKKELEYWYNQKTEEIEKIEAVKNLFSATKADQKALEIVEHYNKIGQECLQNIHQPHEKKKLFIDLAHLLLNREV